MSAGELGASDGNGQGQRPCYTKPSLRSSQHAA